MLFKPDFSFTARPKSPNKQRPLTSGTTEQLSPSAKHSAPRRRSSFWSFRESFRTALTSPNSQASDAISVSHSKPAVASDPPRLPELDGTEIRFAPSLLPKLSFSGPDDSDEVQQIDGDVYSESDFDWSSFGNDDDEKHIEEGLVISSATPIKVSMLGRSLSRAREISLVVGPNIHVCPTTHPTKRPSPLTLAPSVKSQPRSPPCNAINAMQMQHTMPPPPSLQVSGAVHHHWGHSEVAEGVGLQLLVDTLSAHPGDSKRLSTTSISSLSTSVSMPSPVFTIPEIRAASSESSSIDTYDSHVLSGRKGSHTSCTSTIPTSISNSSLCNSPVGVVKPPLIPPRLSSRSSVLFSNSDSGGEPPPVSPVPPRTSRRSSGTSTFFCRGNRNSIPTTLRTARLSIGLSSIGDRGVSLEDYAEDFSHYPGIDELKKQISWLAIQRTATYSSEDEEDEEDVSDEDSYHKYLTILSGAEPRKTVETPTISLNSPDPPMDGGVTWNPPMWKRRTRRRTASSDCLIADVLGSLGRAGEKREKDCVPLGGTPWDCDIFGGFTSAELGEREA